MDELTSPDGIHHLWIDSNSGLKEIMAGFSPKVVAFDSEFVRTRTFFPQPGIIQLYGNEEGRNRILLLDPQSISDWTPLNNLMSDSRILKVVHACSEDLEFFYALGISQPTPLFDTQIASALLGGQLNEGLQKIVRTYLKVDLPKHETRSDWTIRPLSKEQILYAKEDVLYLIPLWQKLNKLLAEQDKTELLLSEGELLTRQAGQPAAESEFYLKLRGAWKLKPKAQYILAKLAHWRETTARKLDRPRGFICSDQDLIRIAEHQPNTLTWLSSQTTIQSATLRRFGKTIINLIENARHLDGNALPVNFALIQPPLPKETKQIYKMLKKKAQQVSVDKGIQPTLLASRTMLEGLLHWQLNGKQGGIPQLMKSWRKQCLGDTLVNMLETKEIVKGQSGDDFVGKTGSRL